MTGVAGGCGLSGVLGFELQQLRLEFLQLLGHGFDLLLQVFDARSRCACRVWISERRHWRRMKRQRTPSGLWSQMRFSYPPFLLTHAVMEMAGLKPTERMRAGWLGTREL
jgi:hypothetical protein